jgi:4'-phosphopantetheinyl transferase
MNIKINQSKIQVRWVKFSSYLGKVVQLKTYLTSDEIERAYKYKFDIDISRFIIGRAFLRMLLGNILNLTHSKIKIEPDKYGKLLLTNQEHKHLHFNISHSDDYVIYAFCITDEVGIDIERIDYTINHLEIAENYFAKNEIIFLKNFTRSNLTAENFYRLWTRKESLLKAIGTGLLLDLKQIDILDDQFYFNKYVSANKLNTNNLW